MEIYNIPNKILILLFISIILIKNINYNINLLINILIASSIIYYFYNNKETKKLNKKNIELELKTEKETETNKLNIENIDYSEPIIEDLNKVLEFNETIKKNLKEITNIINSFYKNINNPEHLSLDKCLFLKEQLRTYLTFPLTKIYEKDKFKKYINYVNNLYKTIEQKYNDTLLKYKNNNNTNFYNNPTNIIEPLSFHNIQNYNRNNVYTYENIFL